MTNPSTNATPASNLKPQQTQSEPQIRKSKRQLQLQLQPKPQSQRKDKPNATRGPEPNSGSVDNNREAEGPARKKPRIPSKSQGDQPSMSVHNTTTAATTARRYFMIIASRDHLHSAMSQGIVQANHGIRGPLARMAPGDGIVLYSPRTSLAKDATVVRAFTGIGQVSPGPAGSEGKADAVYQESVGEKGWMPWRRKAVWVSRQRTREVKMGDVLSRLKCLGYGRERNYGMVLRRGFLEIEGSDWDVLWESMVGEGVDEDKGDGEENKG